MFRIHRTVEIEIGGSGKPLRNLEPQITAR